jgi:hypothetical protein
MSPRRTLSKSDFKLARTCATKLYYRELGYPDNRDENPYLAMLAEGGYMVEQLARLMYPEGIELEYGRDAERNWQATADLLARTDVTLFEGTLLSGRKLARVDILRKRGTRLELIEVKSKSFKGDALSDSPAGPLRWKVKRKGTYPILTEWIPYLEDVTFQYHVLRELFPEALIVPRLIVVDTSRTTTTEGLPGMFDIRRDVDVHGHRRDLDVRFTGDPTAVHPEEILRVIDVTAEVEELLPSVVEAAERFVTLLGDEEPVREITPISWGCRDCEYRVSEGVTPSGFRECWGRLAEPAPHLFDLYSLGSNKWEGERLGDVMIRNGMTGMFDVRVEHLVKRDGTATSHAWRQTVQLEYTREQRTWISEGLAASLAGLGWPLHFIDFETSMLALPYHAGMRPYEMIGFQWSAHTITGPGGAPAHREWLNLSDRWPCGEFVRTLRETIGDEGTVLMWAPHERTTLRTVRQQLLRYGDADDSLLRWLDRLTGDDGAKARLVDLNQICFDCFFHPDMKGRTSIKVVLDAIWKTDPELRARYQEWTGEAGEADRGPYESIEPIVVNGTTLHVADGTGAMRAYQAMVYGAERHDPQIVDGWARLLRRYCKLDTLAMVLIWDHWTRLVR